MNTVTILLLVVIAHFYKRKEERIWCRTGTVLYYLVVVSVLSIALICDLGMQVQLIPERLIFEEGASIVEITQGRERNWTESRFQPVSLR